MRCPPDRQKQCQQQPIQVRSILNPTGFDVEATTFVVLKGGLHPHAPGIFLDLSASGSLITDKNPGFLTSFVPHNAQRRFQRLLLPDFGWAIPAVAWLEHDLLETFPGLLQFPVEVAPIRMLLTDAQEIVPAALLTKDDQVHPC